MLDLPNPFYALGEHIAIDFPGARAVFTTRRGGVSKPPYDSLNLGPRVEEDRAGAAANRELLARELDVALTDVRQVHGTNIHTTEAAPDPGEPPTEADGVATATPNLAAVVLAADCLPIAIAAPGAVVAVHAGWHGLHEGVIAAGVEALRRLAAAQRVPQAPGASQAPEAPPALVAAIGPGASACCYEVSDELHERFAAQGLGYRNGQNLDLKAIAEAQLRAAGVGTIYTLPACTICSPRDLFFSHRRDDGVTGRQAGLVWLT